MKSNKNGKSKSGKKNHVVEKVTEDPLAKIVTMINGAIFLRVLAKANSKNERISIEDDAILIAVSAEPKKGEANKAFIELLSHELCIPKTSIIIEKGFISQDKIFKVSVQQPEAIFESILKILRKMK